MGKAGTSSGHVSLSVSPGPQKKRDKNRLPAGLGRDRAAERASQDSAVTKGGSEYAVSVITLYTSQFVFQYVISIIKLPKQETDGRNSSQGVEGERGVGTEAFFFLITKLTSVRNPFMADWLITRRMVSRR